MIVPDLNLLIYAVNDLSHHHERAKTWWEECLNGKEPVGLAWVVVLGFLRLTTSQRVFSNPMNPEICWKIIDSWLERSIVRILNPGTNHPAILKTLVLENGTGGNLTTDAHLAALTIEHSGGLYTADNDFARFASLVWRNPLVEG